MMICVSVESLKGTLDFVRKLHAKKHGLAAVDVTNSIRLEEINVFKRKAKLIKTGVWRISGAPWVPKVTLKSFLSAKKRTKVVLECQKGRFGVTEMDVTR